MTVGFKQVFHVGNEVTPTFARDPMFSASRHTGTNVNQIPPRLHDHILSSSTNTTALQFPCRPHFVHLTWQPNQGPELNCCHLVLLCSPRRPTEAVHRSQICVAEGSTQKQVPSVSVGEVNGTRDKKCQQKQRLTRR